MKAPLDPRQAVSHLLLTEFNASRSEQVKGNGEFPVASQNTEQNTSVTHAGPPAGSSGESHGHFAPSCCFQNVPAEIETEEYPDGG